MSLFFRMKAIWALLMIIVRVSTQMVEVIPINTENGYTIFKWNEKPIVESFTKILHLVNLTEYNELITLIEFNINLLNFESNDDNLKLLQRELKSLKHNYKMIIPQVYKNHRNKRGLINILGKGLKFLSGTMDDEDATEIYNHLENLDHNTKNTVDQLNKQVIINNNLIKNVEEINKHLNKQQKDLNEFLSKIDNRTSNLITLYNKSKHVLKLYADIKTLNNQIEKLTDIILLSKLNVLAHDILTDEEIDKYNITIEIIPYIRNSVMFNGELLIFAISLPKFTKEKYYSAIVVPFPNSNHEQLDTENKEIIVQNCSIYNSNDNVVIKKDLKPHINYCIRNLFNSNNTCTFKSSNVSVIEQVFNNLIITKNIPITKIEQNCIDEEITIKGNNVIKFGNCKIKIGNQIFVNKIEKFKSNVIILTNHLNLTNKVKKITLEELHLKTVTNREKIDYVNYKNNNVTFVSFGINFVIIIVIILIVILSKVLRKNSRKSEENIKLENRTSYYKKENSNTNPFAETANI